MLHLKNITKTYITGDFKQQALQDINLKFRDCEFVSILGQSGSGKTTMLNIIGGLDKYTSGDLIINGKSTKKYKDRDWDTYRNHSIGFVFQSYNLIPHQTALSNVELALTLSGVPKSEARKRAIKVLEKVGLKEHMNKKPSQMSGGQVQRIAIARALVNDPDILLADEPTGALDSDTSLQIMDLLKDIAKDKLVIMVTHNAELAEEYSTRIVRLSDGKITGDSNPYDEKDHAAKIDENNRKTKMSFITALRLSLNNLMTKKGRTLLTAFAGSIGIIGIALILSLSNGVQNYIDRVEEDTLSSYPITIEEATIDMSSMMNMMMGNSENKEEHGTDKIYSNDILNNIVTTMTTQIRANNLEKFKKYLDDSREIKDLTNDIQYSYNIDVQVYNANTQDDIIKVNPSPVMEKIGFTDSTNGMIPMSSSQTNMWRELLNNQKLLESQYDVVAGTWPKKYNEVVLIVNEDNEVSDYTLYTLGLKDQKEIEGLLRRMINGEEVTFESSSYNYQDILDLKFKLVLKTDYFEKNGNVWVDKSSDEDYMRKVINNSEEIKVVGIIKPKPDAVVGTSYGEIGYTKDLTEHVINLTNEQQIVKDQKAHEDINVFNGHEFKDINAEFDINDLSREEQAYLASLSREEMTEVISTYMDTYGATYDDNLRKLGVADLSKPSMINIYPKDFESKERIAELISEYNDKATDEKREEDVINYTDYVGLMMSSVTSIVDIISYVLMAFVSISLIVSSIMIGIITYISVLERTKEIGILRSIGASKKDISRVFNAETFIVGLIAGIIGIGVTILLNIPINIIIKNITEVSNISKLPYKGAIILVIISMLLTVIAGLIPSRIASKKDPVEALRTE